MIKLLLAPLFCSLLSACGKPQDRATVPVSRAFPVTLSATPLFLFKEVQECLQVSKWQSFEISFPIFISGQRRIEAKNFEGFLRGNIIKNQDLNVISSTQYGEAVEYLLENKNTRIRIESAPKEVDLCPDKTEYGLDSVESAGLSASYFINKASRAFTQATGLFLPPVTVKIAPKIAQTVITKNERKTLYLTDNAFYQADLKTVTFLPHSIEARLGGRGVNYWEIPTVPAHEYGHHIFAAIFGNYNTEITGTHLCYENRMAANHLSPKKRSRRITHVDVLHVFNEGFADLIAHYTLERKESDLSGVTCLERSREVGHENFANGIPKVLTKSAVRNFFSSKSNGPRWSCEEVDFQDIHTMGAIFAHNADRFLSLFTNSPEVKLQALSEWITTLKIRHKELSSLSPERYFEEVFQIFLRLSLRKFGREFDRSSCDEVNRFYSELMNKLVECS